MSHKPDLGTLFGAPKTNSFLGLGICSDIRNLNSQIAIIGAPGATPYATVGAYCSNAPKVLRAASASLSANINRHNFDIDGKIFPEKSFQAVDCGDLKYDRNNIKKNRDLIKSTVSQVIKKNAIPVLLGGDDSVPIPMIEACEDEQNVTIVQLDAHIDWRDSHMDERYGLSSTMRRASEMPHVKKIIQIGARGIGSGHSRDYQDALNWGVNFITADRIHKKGFLTILENLPINEKVIICFDVDIFDPAIVPAVIGRTPGGLSYFQCLDIIKHICAKNKVIAIDFVEFVPELDVDGLGALTVSRFIASTLGILARQKINQLQITD